MSVNKFPQGRQSALRQKIQNDTLSPHRPLEYDLDLWSSNTFTITPKANNLDQLYYAIWINGRNYFIDKTDSTADTVDLSTTGLGGLVDGITLTSNRDCLIWGFANNANTEFEGFAATHKPYSTFTGVSSGTRGATATYTGLTNAFQFTIGARVAVRNTVGTGPLHEWNWGTVTSIDSSSQIKVAMDASFTGNTNITGATGGEILQWDKFRPWVVGASSHSLFRNNYRLLGELHLDGSSNVRTIYKVDSPWRQVIGTMVDTTSAGVTTVTLSAGRYIPLWSKRASAQFLINSNSTNGFTQVDGFGARGRVTAFVINTSIIEYDNITLGSKAEFTASYRGSTQCRIIILDYYVPGGMRI